MDYKIYSMNLILDDQKLEISHCNDDVEQIQRFASGFQLQGISGTFSEDNFNIDSSCDDMI